MENDINSLENEVLSSRLNITGTVLLIGAVEETEWWVGKLVVVDLFYEPIMTARQGMFYLYEIIFNMHCFESVHQS